MSVVHRVFVTKLSRDAKRVKFVVLAIETEALVGTLI